MDNDDSLEPVDDNSSSPTAPSPRPDAPEVPEAREAPDAPVVPHVPMGQAMPETHRLPTLLPTAQALAAGGTGAHVSTLGQGLSFIGSARINGSLTVSGEVQGDIELQGSGSGHVTITQTGTVVGDIRARNISVLGQTVGTLDAAGGRVSLHDTASVSGRIRYTHLQVNGADLNAQLERVRPEGDVAKSGHS
ncbi:MAG TPA: polymer-forming cytoskeletal protein [Ideonella sp.]|jgi:cytoskeletal protein CcmA (bactofilin family)|uniref:bactofilin family protein n=1 Tax=Ideonella sp. TaxID=1929293 RepID=UPI002E345C30|nr:polymer-forming cytoskeletal protein [Ideonella sp.]HEX5683634.1 polymer-forming cytoskeletal protein [Ideonella sp.]